MWRNHHHSECFELSASASVSASASDFRREAVYVLVPCVAVASVLRVHTLGFPQSPVSGQFQP